ncbi:MAG: hypothetical protein ABSC06_40405 [Rhodopila sp.]
MQAHLINELGTDIGGEAPKFQSFLPRVVDAIQQRFGNSVAGDVLGKLLDGLKSAMETVRGLFADTGGTRSQNWVTNIGEIHDTLAQMYAARFGTPVEREQAALAAMKDRAARDRLVTPTEEAAPSLNDRLDSLSDEAARVASSEYSTSDLSPEDKARFFALRGVSSASSSIENMREAVIWGRANGREDVVQAAVDRAQGRADAPVGEPGVPPGHAKYEAVKADLAERKAQDQRNANELANLAKILEPPAAAARDRVVTSTPEAPEASLTPETGAIAGLRPPTGEAATAQSQPDYGVVRDATTAKALQLRRWLDQLAAERDAAAITRPVGGDETKLPPATQTRLDDVRQQLDAVTHPTADTPEMAKVRGELETTAAQLPTAEPKAEAEPKPRGTRGTRGTRAPPTEHPGLIVTEPRTGRTRVIQPPGTVPPAAAPTERPGTTPATADALHAKIISQLRADPTLQKYLTNAEESTDGARETVRKAYRAALGKMLADLAQTDMPALSRFAAAADELSDRPIGMDTVREAREPPKPERPADYGAPTPRQPRANGCGRSSTG